MSKVLFAISLMVLLACGTGESGSGATGSASDTPPVSAMAPSGDDMEEFEVEEIVIVEGEQSDAENAEDQAALAAAQEKTAAEAASGTAADAPSETGN